MNVSAIFYAGVEDLLGQMTSEGVVISVGFLRFLDGVGQRRAKIERFLFVRPKVSEVVFDGHDEDTDGFEAELGGEIGVFGQDDERHGRAQVLPVPSDAAVENPTLPLAQRLAGLSFHVSVDVKFVEEKRAGAGFVRQKTLEKKGEKDEFK